jgi:ABC-type amino acid transport substrate-binding protein
LTRKAADAPAQSTAASEIAPSGTLRVGFQIGSPILAKRAPEGSVSGVVVELGKFTAANLGVAFVPVIYANQEAYARSFGLGEWDIVIGAASASVREQTDTSPDFMLAHAMYIAAPGRVFADASGFQGRSCRAAVIPARSARCLKWRATRWRARRAGRHRRDSAQIDCRPVSEAP